MNGWNITDNFRRSPWQLTNRQPWQPKHSPVMERVIRNDCFRVVIMNVKYGEFNKLTQEFSGFSQISSLCSESGCAFRVYYSNLSIYLYLPAWIAELPFFNSMPLYQILLVWCIIFFHFFKQNFRDFFFNMH